LDEKEEENGELKLGIVREMHESTERQKMALDSLKLKVRADVVGSWAKNQSSGRIALMWSDCGR
jgi:hypothetical protein